MRIMVSSFLWVMQDFYHQPQGYYKPKALNANALRFRVSGLGYLLIWAGQPNSSRSMNP